MEPSVSDLPQLPGREWYDVGDIIMALENRYLAEESCLETEYTFIREGKTEKRHSLHWVYTAGEIRRMLQNLAERMARSLHHSPPGPPLDRAKHKILVANHFWRDRCKAPGQQRFQLILVRDDQLTGRTITACLAKG